MLSVLILFNLVPIDDFLDKLEKLNVLTEQEFNDYSILCEKN
jgi:hypothetical protein